MKKNMFYLMMMILVFLVGSCKDDESRYYEIGSDYTVTSDGLTTLDNSIVFSVSAYDVNSTITVMHMGGLQDDEETGFTVPNTDLGSFTLTDGEGSISVDESKMGLQNFKWTADVRLTAKAGDGTPMHRLITVDYHSPFAVVAPVVTPNDEDVDFTYEITPANQEVTGVTIQTKKNFNGVYAAVAGTFEAADTFQLNGNGYVVGDTLYVKITATTAVKTASEVTKIPIETYSFSNSKTVRLSPLAATSIYDFGKLRYIPAADEAAMLDSVDIKYLKTDVLGGFDLGFTAPQNAEFIKVTGTPDEIDAVFSLGDVFVVRNADFGTSVQTVDKVVADDVYLFRTQRGASDYIYGMLKITSVKKPDGDPQKSYFDFIVKTEK